MEFLNALFTLFAFILNNTPDAYREALFTAVPSLTGEIEALEPVFRFIFIEDLTIEFEPLDN